MPDNKITSVAQEIMIFSRNTLLVNLRFLDMALGMLELKPSFDTTLMTDGEYLYFSPKYILKCYRAEDGNTVRDYLHVVLHCVYRHMFVDPELKRPLWDLACDVAVENIIHELGMSATASPKENAQSSFIAEIKREVKLLTAEKIYYFLIKHEFTDDKANAVRKHFTADDHSPWYGTAKKEKDSRNASDGDQTDKKDTEKNEAAEKDIGETDKSNDDRQCTENDASDVQNGTSSNKKQSMSETSASDGQDGVSSDKKQSEFETSASDGQNGVSSDKKRSEFETSASDGAHKAKLTANWKTISERMQLELEIFVKKHGDPAGGLIQNLLEVNREKYDYTEFLKKFAALGEEMKINDDEFDYIFYTYGLNKYGNMPLIEPLEYKEVKRIREFVIAIDTSGSVRGELVQKFLQKTYNILKTEESFASRINIRIIQCDAVIQENVKITDQEEFDRYIATMKLHGFGGTDFRPVFAEVQRLIASGELKNLGGLIYFTDGVGIFPAKNPGYKTAFVFIEDNYFCPDVPPWAIRLVLQREEITVKGFGK